METIQIKQDGIPDEVTTCDGIVIKCKHKPGQCYNCCYSHSCKLPREGDAV